MSSASAVMAATRESQCAEALPSTPGPAAAVAIAQAKLASSCALNALIRSAAAWATARTGKTSFVQASSVASAHVRFASSCGAKARNFRADAAATAPSTVMFPTRAMAKAQVILAKPCGEKPPSATPAWRSVQSIMVAPATASKNSASMAPRAAQAHERFASSCGANGKRVSRDRSPTGAATRSCRTDSTTIARTVSPPRPSPRSLANAQAMLATSRGPSSWRRVRSSTSSATSHQALSITSRV
mmetsp:Transcript_96604/g.273109  ORF Transcript_96604/g.273109 Transcript_96604/m.273109 type:complete len:244 (+) Transcript_96604:1240-1971(+)